MIRVHTKLNLTCWTLIIDFDEKTPSGRYDIFAIKILTESIILSSDFWNLVVSSVDVTFVQMRVHSSKSQPCLAAICNFDSVSTRNKRTKVTFIVLLYVILTKL